MLKLFGGGGVSPVAWWMWSSVSYSASLPGWLSSVWLTHAGRNQSLVASGHQ